MPESAGSNASPLSAQSKTLKKEVKLEPNDKTPVTKDPRRLFRWKIEASVQPISTPPDFNKWNSHKAGLENVDRARVQEIVTSLTEGSSHYERQKQKAKERQARTNAIKVKVDKARASPERLRRRQYIVDHNVIPDMEFRRLRNHVRVCVDFDCFYAAVEAQDNPALVGKPHAVSMGPGKHSILATSSYEARKFGVRSGMPVFIGQQLCPHMIIMPARMERYAEVSKIMELVLVKYDPDYSLGSLDEAFLDITHLVNDERSAANVVNDLRQDIKEATGGLTVSAGCAPNLLIAKIGADMKKPDGQTILLPAMDESEKEFSMKFMSTLPLRKVPGIGEVTENMLQGALGFEVVGDIYSDRATVAEVFTDYRTRLFLRYALGLGCLWTDTYDERLFVRKGIGCNRTFGRENNEQKLFEQLRIIAEILERDMTDAGVVGARTFTLRLKTSSFVSFGRSVTLPPGAMVSTADDFELFGRKILQDHMPIELRRIGMKLHKLTWHERPKGSIKQFLVGDEAAEIESKDWKSSAQIIQARERAKRYFYDEFVTVTRSKEVSFRASITCPACSDAQKKNGIKHILQYSCPICSIRCFKYLAALNGHVDECLGDGEKKVKVKQEKRTLSTYLRKRKSTPKRAERKRAAIKLEKPEPKQESVIDNSNQDHAKTETFVGAKRELWTTESDDTDSDFVEITEPSRKKVKRQVRTSPSKKRKRAEIGTGITCPICKVETFDDNTKLNAHLDICLNFNSDVLKELKEERRSVKKEVQPQRKCTISTFFKKRKVHSPRPSPVKPRVAPKVEDPTILCPVCKNIGFKNPQQLDLHIDECLSVTSGLLKTSTT